MFFQDHAVLFALICAFVAVLHGLYLTLWLLRRPAGNERMQEIARAVQEGAAAYLKKQYTAVALVAIVPFLLLGLYDKLGWGSAFGFLIGAGLSAAAGFIGMNVAVRSNVRTAAAAQDGLKPAFDVAFKAGSVTGLLVVGLGLLGVAGYYLLLTQVIGPLARLGHRRPGRARVRRLVDLGVRATRRRDLHEGGGRRRRPGRARSRPASPRTIRGTRP